MGQTNVRILGTSAASRVCPFLFYSTLRLDAPSLLEISVWAPGKRVRYCDSWRTYLLLTFAFA